MIAQFDVVLPFELTVPEGEQFILPRYQINKYKVQIMPPIKTDVPLKGDTVEQVFLNGKKAFIANGLRILFHKKRLNRKVGIEHDPPLSLIEATLNMFLSNVRFVTRNKNIKTIDLKKSNWRITYLHDDGSEFKKNKKYARAIGSRAFTFEWGALNKKIWKDVISLPLNYAPPQWEMLLIDANSVLPEVGPSLVLLTTSLEVFISHILNELVKINDIPENLWNWLNLRGQSSRNPSLSEKFDSLLNAVAGFSLKEDKALWKSFNSIRDARNKFAHKGIAKINKKEVTEAQARALAQKVREIIEFIKDKIPEQLHWQTFEYKITIEGRKKIK